MNSMNNMYMSDMRMDDQSYDYMQSGGDSTSTTRTSSQTLSVPAFFPCTTSPASSDSSYLAGMLEAGGSPLLSVYGAGNTSPLASFSPGETQRTSGSFRTSLTGSTFSDYPETGGLPTLASQTSAIITPTSAQDFSLFDNMSWHGSQNNAGTDGIYGSYQSDAGSRTGADLSPLQDLTTSPQRVWLSDEDAQLSRSYSLSPHPVYHSGELDITSTSPGHGLSDAMYFSPNTEMPIAWSTDPSTESSTNLQLPAPTKDHKRARFSNKLSSTKLPQVVTSNYHDGSIDFMSSMRNTKGHSSTGVETSSQASGISLSISTGSHKHGSSSGRRSSSNVSSGAGHEVRKTKSHHSGKSGSSNGSSGTKKEFVCEHAYCNSPAFTRMADLDRHIKHIHLDADKKEQFFCDYTSCSRSTTPFHRKDHYREHLREYHLEDLLKRGSNAHRSTSPNTASGMSASDHKKNRKLMQEMQLQNCKTDSLWWRCARCLKRVNIAERGWSCPTCKGSIEEPRRNLRSVRAVMGDSSMDGTMQATDTVPNWSYGAYP